MRRLRAPYGKQLKHLASAPSLAKIGAASSALALTTATLGAMLLQPDLSGEGGRLTFTAN
jgi:hypothetical protein